MAAETFTLEFLGKTLLAIQAEQRTLRTENALIRKELGRLASRDDLLDVVRMLSDRIANFEALIETRIGDVGARLDEIVALIAGAKGGG